MKTKTPKQIDEQYDRITDALQEVNARYDKVTEICLRYISNIYKANGVDDDTCSASVSNKIWHQAATPASVYMSK